MAENLFIKMDLSLERLSINVTAIKLWESPVFKRKIKELFENSPDNVPKMEDFTKIADQVLQKLQDIILPRRVIADLEDTVRFVGEKIYYWNWRAQSDFGLDFKHAENISWTCYGTVDETETFRLHWQNDPELLLNAKNDIQRSLFSIACLLGQHEFVSWKFSEMKNILRDHYGIIPEITSVNSLIEIWICFYFGIEKNVGLELYHDLVANGCNARICFMVATKGYLNAFKYLSGNLNTDSVRERPLKEILRKNMRSMKKDMHIETIMFLMSNIPPGRKSSFLKDNWHHLFALFINIWPYQEFALQLINFTLPFTSEIEHGELLNYLTDYFHVYEGESAKTKHRFKSIAHQALQKVLESGSKYIKKKCLIDARYVFYNLVMISDFRTMNIILSDPDVMCYKDEIVKYARHVYYEMWQRRGELTRLNEFMRMFLTQDEKKPFLSSFNNSLEYYVSREMFEDADKLLCGLTDSDEEKALLKKGLNSTAMLTHLSSNQNFCVVTAAKILNWQFQGDEEKTKSAKIAFRTDKFVRNEFYRIWCGNCLFSVETSKTKCSELLNFFFEPDEIEPFKKFKIIRDKGFIEIFCDHLSLPENFKTVDELLKFCCVPAEGIKEMKQEILCDIKRLILYFGIEKKWLKLAFALVDWVTEEKENKKEVIEKFINSPEGGKLCFEIIDKCSTCFYDDVVMLLNLWVKPYGDITKICRFCIQECSDNKHCKIIFLFDTLGKKEFMSKKDVQKYFPM